MQDCIGGSRTQSGWDWQRSALDGKRAEAFKGYVEPWHNLRSSQHWPRLATLKGPIASIGKRKSVASAFLPEFMLGLAMPVPPVHNLRHVLLLLR